MQPLIQFLQRSGLFTEPQIDQIRSGVISRTLQKGEHFAGPGSPALEIGFVLKGILRAFSNIPEGQESTLYFIDENNFALAGGSESIQAVMRTELAILSCQDLQSSSFTIVDWDKLANLITVRTRMDKAEQMSPTLAGDATARYRMFMEKYPQIAGRVPLGFLASYLAITQQSLSRIRKQLTRKSPPRENQH